MLEHEELDIDLLLDLMPRDLALDLLVEAMELSPRFARWYADEAARQQTAAERAATEAAAQRAGRWLESYFRSKKLSRSLRSVPREETAPRARGTAGQVLPFLDADPWAPLVELPVAAGTGMELWDVVVDTWLRLPDDVPRGQYIALPIRGRSMEPVLGDGDTVLVKVENRAAPGSIIVARTEEQGYVVKYVERRSERGIELASLNPDYPDTIAARDPQAVVGTVIARFVREEG